jgi:hypothetical protein
VGLGQWVGNRVDAIGDAASQVREAVVDKVDDVKQAVKGAEPAVVPTPAGANQAGRPNESQASHVSAASTRTPTAPTVPTRRPDAPEVPVVDPQAAKPRTGAEPVYRGEIKVPPGGVWGWVNDRVDPLRQAAAERWHAITNTQPILVEHASFVLRGESIARGNADASYNRYLGDAVRDQIRPAIEPYLAGNGEPKAFSARALTELVGAALHEAPSEAAAADGQLRYEGAARARIDRVAQALMRAGGTHAPKLSVVPVFVRNDRFEPFAPTVHPQFSAVPLFRVVAADGTDRFVDAQGSTYRDLEHWKQTNALPPTDVIVPKQARLGGGRGGQVELESFSNQRWDNLAWAAAKTTVYGAAGVAGAVALASGGAVVAGPVFVAGSVVGAIDGVDQIKTLVEHKRPPSFSDPEWRGALLTTAASSLSLGNGVLQSQQGLTAQLLTGAESATGLLETTEAGRQFVQQYGQMTPAERLQAAAQISFFGALAAGSTVKSVNDLRGGTAKADGVSTAGTDVDQPAQPAATGQQPQGAADLGRLQLDGEAVSSPSDADATGGGGRDADDQSEPVSRTRGGDGSPTLSESDRSELVQRARALIGGTNTRAQIEGTLRGEWNNLVAPKNSTFAQTEISTAVKEASLAYRASATRVGEHMKQLDGLLSQTLAQRSAAWQDRVSSAFDTTLDSIRSNLEPQAGEIGRQALRLALDPRLTADQRGRAVALAREAGYDVTAQAVQTSGTRTDHSTFVAHRDSNPTEADRVFARLSARVRPEPGTLGVFEPLPFDSWTDTRAPAFAARLESLSRTSGGQASVGHADAVLSQTGGDATTRLVFANADEHSGVERLRDVAERSDVINVSFAWEEGTDILLDVIDQFPQKTFVFPAGNHASNLDGGSELPDAYIQHKRLLASRPNVVMVAAGDAADRVAPYTNTGVDSVDIATRGDVPVVTGGTTAWTDKDGTSLAVPRVATALTRAKMLSRAGADDPGLAPELLVQLLRRTAAPNASWQGANASGGVMDHTRLLETAALIGQLRGGSSPQEAASTLRLSDERLAELLPLATELAEAARPPARPGRADATDATDPTLGGDAGRPVGESMSGADPEALVQRHDIPLDTAQRIARRYDDAGAESAAQAYGLLRSARMPAEVIDKFLFDSRRSPQATREIAQQAALLHLHNLSAPERGSALDASRAAEMARAALVDADVHVTAQTRVGTALQKARNGGHTLSPALATVAGDESLLYAVSGLQSQGWLFDFRRDGGLTALSPQGVSVRLADSVGIDDGAPDAQTSAARIRDRLSQAVPELPVSPIDVNRAPPPRQIRSAIDSTAGFGDLIGQTSSLDQLAQVRFGGDAQPRGFDLNAFTPAQRTLLQEILLDGARRADFGAGRYGSQEAAEIGTQLKNQVLHAATGNSPVEGQLTLVAQEIPRRPGSYTDYVVQSQQGSLASEALIREFGTRMWAGYPVVHRPDQEGLLPQDMIDEVAASARDKVLILAYPTNGDGAATATVQASHPDAQHPLGYVGDLTSTMKGGGTLILKASVAQTQAMDLPGAMFTAYAGRGEPNAGSPRLPGNAEGVLPARAELVHRGLTNSGLSNPPTEEVLTQIRNLESDDLGFYLRDPLGGRAAGFGSTDFSSLRPQVLNYRLAPTTGTTEFPDIINQTTRFSLTVPFSESARQTVNAQALGLLAGDQVPHPAHLQQRSPQPYGFGGQPPPPPAPSFWSRERDLFAQYFSQYLPNRAAQATAPARASIDRTKSDLGVFLTLPPDVQRYVASQMAQDTLRGGADMFVRKPIASAFDRMSRAAQRLGEVPGQAAAAAKQGAIEGLVFSQLPLDSKLHVTQDVFAGAFKAYWTAYKNLGDPKLAEAAANRAAERALRDANNPNPLDRSQIAASAGLVGSAATKLAFDVPMAVAKAAIKWGLPPAAALTLTQLAIGDFRVVNVTDSKNLPENARANFNIESGIPASIIETGVQGGPHSVVVAAWNPGKEAKLFLPFPTRPDDAWAQPYVVNSNYALQLNAGAGYLASTGGVVPSQLRLAYYLGEDTNFGLGAQLRVTGPRALANPLTIMNLKVPEDGRSLKAGAYAVLDLLPQISSQFFVNAGALRFATSEITNQASLGAATVHTGAPETGWQGLNGTLGNQFSFNAGNPPTGTRADGMRQGGNYLSSLELLQVNPGFDKPRLDESMEDFNLWLEEVLRSSTSTPP